MADTTSLHLRLPKRLYKRLQQQAKRNNVSLNTEIINQLEGHEAATVERAREIIKPMIQDATTKGFAATLLLLSQKAADSDAEQDLLARIERLAEPVAAFLGPERGEEQK